MLIMSRDTLGYIVSLNEAQKNELIRYIHSIKGYSKVSYNELDKGRVEVEEQKSCADLHAEDVHNAIGTMLGYKEPELTTSVIKSINQQAHEIIYGDREKTYGHPAKNLLVIAEFWNTYLKGITISDNQGLTAEDVCIMMSLLKLARLKNDPEHKDSQVDTCGYMGLLERVQEAPAVKVPTDTK